MEIGTIIAVVGTLVGVVVSGIMTYLLQQRAAERQRKWAMEDVKRNKEMEIESERRKFKRELLAGRLEVVEEMVGAMVKCISNMIDVEIGFTTHLDKEWVRNMGYRIDETYSDALAAVTLTGSKELKDNWTIISKVYWDGVESGSIDPRKGEEVTSAHIAAIKILDNIRTLGE